MNMHGKNAVIYLGAGGGEAEFLDEQVDWSLDMDNAFVDTSHLNLQWKEFVKGMIGYSGTFGGNFDAASTQLWLAAISNYAEKFYLYPTSESMGLYYYGTAWVTLNKIAAGSTTAKASNSFKIQGNKKLNLNP